MVSNQTVKELRRLLLVSLVLAVWAIFLLALISLDSPGLWEPQGMKVGVVILFVVVPGTGLVLGALLLADFVIPDGVSASTARRVSIGYLCVGALLVLAPWTWAILAMLFDSSSHGAGLALSLGVSVAFLVGWGRKRLVGRRLIAGLAAPLISVLVARLVHVDPPFDAPDFEGFVLTFIMFFAGGIIFSGLIAQFPAMLWYAIQTPVEDWGPSSASEAKEPSAEEADANPVFEPVHEDSR
jgi:hypothetical protein